MSECVCEREIRPWCNDKSSTQAVCCSKVFYKPPLPDLTISGKSVLLVQSFLVFSCLNFNYWIWMLFTTLCLQSSLFKNGRGGMRFASFWHWWRLNMWWSVKLLWHCFQCSYSWRPTLQLFAGCSVCFYMFSFRGGYIILVFTPLRHVKYSWLMCDMKVSVLLSTCLLYSKLS